MEDLLGRENVNFSLVKPEENDEASLISYVLDKIEIADDFIPKMKAKDRRDLRNKLLGLKSKRAIDIYFRN